MWQGFENLKVEIFMWKTKVRRRGIAGIIGWWLNSYNSIVNKWLIWIMLWSKIDRNEPRDMAKWFCYTTMSFGEKDLEIAWMGHPSAPAVFLRPGAIWLTCSHQWDTRLQSSTSAISKTLEDGSMNGCRKRKTVFLARWSKCVKADGQSLE